MKKTSKILLGILVVFVVVCALTFGVMELLGYRLDPAHTGDYGNMLSIQKNDWTFYFTVESFENDITGQTDKFIDTFYAVQKGWLFYKPVEKGQPVKKLTSPDGTDYGSVYCFSSEDVRYWFYVKPETPSDNYQQYWRNSLFVSCNGQLCDFLYGSFFVTSQDFTQLGITGDVLTASPYN